MSEQQSIRDELAATIHENFNACRGRGGVSPDALAEVILASPVIRRIQAAAWDDGFDAHDMDWKHHDANNWGNEDCIDATYNPYRETGEGS